jgi:hypothetical protein
MKIKQTTQKKAGQRVKLKHFTELSIANKYMKKGPTIIPIWYCKLKEQGGLET